MEANKQKHTFHHTINYNRKLKIKSKEAKEKHENKMHPSSKLFFLAIWEWKSWIKIKENVITNSEKKKEENKTRLLRSKYK